VTAKPGCQHRQGVEPAEDERKLPVKPTEWCVRGKKVPNAVNLTLKLSDLTRSRVPGRRVAATRDRPDDREEPDDDGESTGEARARRGGPKNRRSTPQEAKATHTSATTNHKTPTMEQIGNSC
jgi:hypothetical protein